MEDRAPNPPTTGESALAVGANGDAVVTSLLAHPMFAGLDPAAGTRLADPARRRTFKKGDTVCREGEPADACFLILRGELDVWARGSNTPVRRLEPGELVGEVGVLLGGGRTATVTAARSAELLELPGAEFQRTVAGNARAQAHVSRLLAQRLALTTHGTAPRRAPSVIAVHGDVGSGTSLVAGALTALLAEITGRPALLLVARPLAADADHRTEPWLRDLADETDHDLASRLEPAWVGGPPQLVVAVALPDPLPTGPTPNGDHPLGLQLDAVVTRLRSRASFVVLDLPAGDAVPSQTVAEVSDIVIDISPRPTMRPRPAQGRRIQLVNQHDRRARPVSVNTNEPFVLQDEPRLAGLEPVEAARLVVDDPLSPSGRTLRRLARTLLGATVGLALGGGAAFGLAHIGVLRVLDDAAIPVDLLVGTSMGSIVACGYAAGIPPRQMQEVAVGMGTSPTRLVSLLDLNPTRPGVLSSDRLRGAFAPFLGSVETFADLSVPCRTVAADIESGERVCLTEGRLDEAFRASSSVPMLFDPTRRGDRILVDGAVVDPVPAEVAREMGADLCVAVNVVPHLRRGVTTALSRVIHRMGAVNPLSHLSRTRNLPGFSDVALNTIQSLQHELGHFKAATADVRINPDLADITWIEFYRAQDIIERGAAAAEAAVPEIRRLLDERVATAHSSS